MINLSQSTFFFRAGIFLWISLEFQSLSIILCYIAVCLKVYFPRTKLLNSTCSSMGSAWTYWGIRFSWHFRLSLLMLILFLIKNTDFFPSTYIFHARIQATLKDVNIGSHPLMAVHSFSLKEMCLHDSKLSSIV